MLDNFRVQMTQNWAVQVGAALLAIGCLAGCALNANAQALALASPLSPTTRPFRFPTPTPTPLPTPASAATVEGATATDPTPYRFAVLAGDLAAAYPALSEHDRFTLHYDPDAPPAIAPDELATLVAQILAHHEQMLGATLTGRFDVYAAGTLFAPPDQALRGHSFSRSRRFHVVVDNGITSAAQRYIVAHELTHLFAWNTFGVPSSVLLSEGLAVYAGLDFAGDGLLPLRDFCAAYAQAGALPHVSANLVYQGHIRNLEHYYAAGCFVQFLIEEHGAAAFARLYSTGDYTGVYGQSLADLETAWLAEAASTPLAAPISPAALVTAVDQTQSAYLALLAAFEGLPEQVTAYRRLDAQWSAVLAGQIADEGGEDKGTEHE